MSELRQHDSAPDRPVSVLTGDRLCIKCGYNLTGQPVLREPHYDMLIARCPECATVASLQEYPVLGRWVGRWAALLAALWLGFILALTLVTSLIIWGFCEAVVDKASLPHAEWLATRQMDDFKQAEAQGTLSQTALWIVANPPSPHTMIDATWLSQQDVEVLLAEAGGWTAAADFSALGNWIWIGLATVPMGCVWAVVLLHPRRRWLLLLCLVPVVLGGVFYTMSYLSTPARSAGWGYIDAATVVQRQIGMPLAIMTLAFVVVPLSVGLLIGRSVVRGLVRALLPPRLRSSLALLWTADNLDPPRPPRSR